MRTREFRVMRVVSAVLFSLASLAFSPSAQAAATIDVSFLELAPGTTVSETFEVTPELFCMSVTGPSGVKKIGLENGQLTAEIGGTYPQFYLQPTFKTTVNRSAKFCFDVRDSEPEGDDFSQASNFIVRGKINFESYPSATLPLQLKAQGLQLEKTYGLMLYYDDSTNKTVLSGGFKNISKTGQVYKLTSVSVNGAKSIGFDSMLYLTPESQQWMALGSVTGDISKNLANANVVIKFAKVKTTTLTGKIKLPKGLLVQKFSPAGWSAFGKKTTPCLPVTNSTGKDIWVASKLAFSIGKSKSWSKGFSVDVVQAKKTACLSGLDSTALQFKGDVRLGKSAKVSGTVKVVKAPKFALKALVLPEGYKLQSTPTVSYDAKAKRSSIYFTVVGAQGVNSNLKLNNVKVNKYALKTDIVVGSCECGGPGYDSTSRSFLIDNIPGDLRSNVTVAIQGTLTALPATIVSGTYMVSTDPEQASCSIYHPEFWTFKGGITSVAFACYNTGASAVTFNVSQLQLKAVTAGNAEQTYTPIVDTITIPAKGVWKEYTTFLVAGDARAQASLEFIGVATLTVN